MLVECGRNLIHHITRKYLQLNPFSTIHFMNRKSLARVFTKRIVSINVTGKIVCVSVYFVYYQTLYVIKHLRWYQIIESEQNFKWQIKYTTLFCTFNSEIVLYIFFAQSLKLEIEQKKGFHRKVVFVFYYYVFLFCIRFQALQTIELIKENC